MMILAMAFPNIFGLYFLSKEVKTDLKDYFRRLKSGEIKKYY
jgi:AGCS family alanine or glycine:cation symporter